MKPMPETTSYEPGAALAARTPMMAPVVVSKTADAVMTVDASEGAAKIPKPLGTCAGCRHIVAPHSTPTQDALSGPQTSTVASIAASAAAASSAASAAGDGASGVVSATSPQ